MNVPPSDSDLGPGLRADVVGADDRAEPSRGPDGLQAGHARAEYEHLGWPGRASGRDQQRKEAPVGGRRQQGGLVTGDVGLRRQRVHRLGPGQRPRDQVEADRRRSRLGKLAGKLGIGQRSEHAQQRLAGSEPGDLRGVSGWPTIRMASAEAS